jgi:hypothetical protein
LRVAPTNFAPIEVVQKFPTWVLTSFAPVKFAPLKLSQFRNVVRVRFARVKLMRTNFEFREK